MIKKIISEFNSLTLKERIILPIMLVSIISVCVYCHDNPVGIVSVCGGILFTFFAGKGKIYCNYFGIIGGLTYAYMSFITHLYGNAALYIGYYVPMQITGLIVWRKHLESKESTSFKKTHLSNKERVIYSFLIVIATLVVSFLLKKVGASSPVLDALTTVMSIFGQIFMLKRCLEQWYIFTTVNAITSYIWIVKVFVNGEPGLSLVLNWIICFSIAVPSLINWHKEIRKQSKELG
ncbi:MAG: nicotinamide riboside transporter PnuC [Alphaproteobacteria bacterium]|nr:nicotinamide riboside transporter PnuC [Alphaproteobacteria bacterium]